ncbi:FAD-dependent monooxygenase [Actinoplanes sp. NPDC049548]|uniref:FAD-dependent monooxygenase n=1 Tax=Actinoplanes sp. NPDC049548 TaxID=3155152 RepID=UPI00341D56E0
MMDQDTDVCVVGGGPAGLTLALLLLRSGVRTTVVERSGSLEREFRGEILQPGGMAVLHRLGVLDAAREHGGHEHDRFLFLQNDRVLINGDYRRLDTPWNYLLSIPQQHVLGELLEACRRYDGFTYLGGRKVTELLTDGGVVRGVVCDRPGGATVVTARCVVGADGRYSKVRRLAGIEAGRIEAFEHDVVWFKLRRSGPALREVRIFHSGGNPMLAYTSGTDHLQLGWTLPHRRYGDLMKLGFPHLKQQIRAAAPPYADLIEEQLTGVRDLTLLDVFSGCATEWVRDGLVLIGDSAHTHSPIGAQGINLAVQDAVVLHPILVAALRAGSPSAASLRPFERIRRPHIGRMMKIQALQSKAMFSSGRVVSKIRPQLAAAVSRTPLYRPVMRQIAFGDRTVRVADELFRPPVHADQEV